MNPISVLVLSITYLLILFFIANLADRMAKQHKSIANDPYIYALSLAVYCTAWTYFGSVGRAAAGGVSFLAIYIGPTLLAPLWVFVLKKIIIISKNQRITSIADFISARYGKSSSLGTIVTIIAILGIIPYISLQLKAISLSYNLLIDSENVGLEHQNMKPFYADTAFYFSILLAFFTIFFGTRNLDPNEKHEGLVSAVAFESIVKLVAFIAGGLYITYGVYHGIGDIFSEASKIDTISTLFTMQDTKIKPWEWMWLMVVSMSAILFLPRQFHVAVVENVNPNFVHKAIWVFPLYMLLINIFVLPIAVGGLLHFGNGVDADMFILEMPLYYGKNILAFIIFIGGFSAASSMVIVEAIALSIMVSNHIFTPLILETAIQAKEMDLNKRLLAFRRLAIFFLILTAYSFYRVIGLDYSLVSIGLISFTAVLQFAPAIIGGIYWKKGTKKGAITGLVVGFLIWAITLPLPTLAEVNIISPDFIEKGLFNIPLLKPYELFGLTGMSPISLSGFWSLGLNTVLYVVISLYTKPSRLELTQADLFVDIYKYVSAKEFEFETIKRQAKMSEIKDVLSRFLGTERANQLLNQYAEEKKINLQELQIANAELVNYAETHLSGALGSASAKIALTTIVKEENLSLEEMLIILDKTQEAIQYSKALEETTQQLKEANERLRELDALKADFITTVTHELKTPITSIRAFSAILRDYPDLPKERSDSYLSIIVSECDRITRLINEVLDLEKIESSTNDKEKLEILDFVYLVRQSILSLEQLFVDKGIHVDTHFPNYILKINGNRDRIQQVVINLLSNAIKFCNNKDGKIDVSIEDRGKRLLFKVKDNGEGIAKDKQQIIFDRFTQLQSNAMGKPKGSGLGLFISRRIVELHDGNIWVESKLNEGASFIVELPTAG